MMVSSTDIEAAVKASHVITAAAELAANRVAFEMPVEDLKAIVALGSHQDTGVNEQVLWAAQKALHAKTGEWE